MKAPRLMWIHGTRYDEGDPIPKELTRTARVLIQIADLFNGGSHEVQGDLP